MGKFSLNILIFSLAMASTIGVQAATTPTQQLLEQLRFAESLNRNDLIDQALSRLALTDDNNPDVIAARLRLFLRQGNNEGAKQQLDALLKVAPDSQMYREAFIAYLLATPELRLQLQQARLLATHGNISESIAAYQKIFDGNEPTGDLAIEYWMTVAKQPSKAALALNKLTAMRQKDPDNVQVQSNLARILFIQGRSQQGFQLLEEMAKSRNGRDEAAKVWYSQIQAMPVSQTSTDALQRFLVIFNDEGMANQARVVLDTQKKQLTDPGFQARTRGLAYLNKGNSGAAIPQLKAALRSNSNDSEIVGALGQAYSQLDQRELAIKQLLKAIKMDPTSRNRKLWDSLLKTNRYWLLIAQGEKQLEQNQSAAAQQSYLKARMTNPSDSSALLGLGDVALAQQKYADAERYYQQALRMYRNNSSALRSLVSIYSQQSEVRAAQFIASLSPCSEKEY